MMTSAPTYPMAADNYPSPTPISTSELMPASVGKNGGDESGPASLPMPASLRLVKRSLSFVADPCKKRRKQSTPIRISTTGVNVEVTADDNANGAVLGVGLSCEGKLGPFLSSPDHDHSLVDTPMSALAPGDQILPQVKLEPLPDYPPDKTADTAEISNPVNLSGGQKFPPWMSDMSIKTDDWLGSTNLQPVSFSTTYLPSSSASITITNSSQQLRNVVQPPTRIFNPEAFCELCNKEFCNKYFLKTHKANKHRIYTDPPNSEMVSIGVPVNVPTYTTSTTKKPTPLITCDVVSPKNVDGSKCSLLADTSFQNVICNICRKEFSNNTLLNAHKTSTHGIPTDQEQDAECVVDTLPNIVLPNIVNREERDTELSDANLNNDDDKEALLLKNDHMKEEPATLSMPEQDESSMSAAPLGMRDNLDFSTNRLRRLGIMNPEAFCDICCKEYCNKYFLRTHKMKRHGILIPDDNSKDNQKDFKLELSFSNNWYQIQTSPLNLIMGEQNTNSSGSHSERKSPPSNETECEICGMRFQTSYLAQLHSAAAHMHYKTSNGGDRDASNHNNECVKTLSINNNDKHAPDSISEDLQKLQTMILQLNDLDVSKVGMNASGVTTLSCNLCNKEFENRYYLHAHMMTEHGVLLEDTLTDINKQSEMESTLESNTCKLCGREGFTLESLRHHVSECHAVSVPGMISASVVANTTTTTTITAVSANSKDDSNGFVNPDKVTTRISGTGSSLGTERRSSITLTPTSSYCEICNKELCNKYFMKTHMQRMHGIEIENGAQIGGVVCNICNKELCSKYFLRVHKHNTHGIVEEGTNATTTTTQRQTSTDLDHQSSSTDTNPVVSTDPALKPTDLSDLSHRYFTHFTEVCTICSRRFRSTKWLKAHLLGDHGKLGVDKWNELELQLQQSFGQQLQTPPRKPTGDRVSPPLRIPNSSQDANKSDANLQNVLSSLFGTDDTNVKQYQCSFCPFSTPVLAFLFVHERSHAHTRPASAGDVDGIEAKAVSNNMSSSSLQCTVCSQLFRQPDQLHHHIISQHSFLSLGPFFSFAPQAQANKQQSAPDVRCDLKQESISEVDQPVEQKSVKCMQCGQSKKPEINAMLANKAVELSADVSIALKDVSKQKQLPATYALPQRSQQQTKYMMQAFLMDEPSGSGSPMDNNSLGTCNSTEMSVVGDEQQAPQVQQVCNNNNNNNKMSSTGGSSSSSSSSSSNNNNNNGTSSRSRSSRSASISDRRFAPSIVFLPVLEKLTAPLTVSFTLTPA